MKKIINIALAFALSITGLIAEIPKDSNSEYEIEKENKIKFYEIIDGNPTPIKLNKFIDLNKEISHLQFSYKSKKEIIIEFFHGGMGFWDVDYNYNTIEGDSDYDEIEKFGIDSFIITLPPSKNGNGSISLYKLEDIDTAIKIII